MAGSSVIGALRVSLGLDSAQFETGAAKAEKRAATMGGRISQSVKQPTEAIGSLQGALTGLAGALALKELAGATQRAFDYADAIQDLSDRTGASAKLIQEFRYAAQLSGSSVDVADEALGKFTKTLGLAQAGSDEQVKLFRSLGVTSRDFEGAFRQTLEGLAKLPSVQQRNAVALQLFGKSAATLTGLLGQGTAGFDDLARSAGELGIVLSDDVIRNAGGANDKLDTLKMILDAQFANAVTQNANSIVSLAEGITKLTSAVLGFLQSNPRTALGIMGALAGGRAGLPGAAIGGFAGVVAGDQLGRAAADQNMDLKFRRQQFRAAIADRRARQRASASGSLVTVRRKAGDGDGSAAEVVRQGLLYKKAIAAAQGRTQTARPAGDAPLPSLGNNEAAAAGRQAAADAKRRAADARRASDKEAADTRRYEQDLARGRGDELRAQLDLTTNQVERAALQDQLLANEHEARLEEISLDKDLNEERKKQLSEQENETYRLRQAVQTREQQEVVAREALDRAQAANDNQNDLLTAQAGLARTAKQRGALELQILDLQFEQLRLVQQAIIDSASSSDQQKALAQDRLRTLNQLQGLAQQRSARDNAGPLAQYLDGIPRTADEVNEALEGIQANGLSSLIDGLSDVKGGFKDLASVVDNVSHQIIASLLKIALQRGVSSLFGRIFGGAIATSSAGGVTGSTSFLSSGLSAGGGSGLPTLSGARASGGPVIGGKAYLVGERGPEPFIPSRSGTILPNSVLQGGAPSKVEVHVLAGEYFDARVGKVSGGVTANALNGAQRNSAARGRQALG